MASTTPTTVGCVYLGCEVDGERRSSEAIARVVMKTLEAHGIEGATMWSGIGLYQGASEPAIVVEVIGHGAEALAALAADLREHLDQDEVAWTAHAVERGAARRDAQ